MGSTDHELRTAWAEGDISGEVLSAMNSNPYSIWRCFNRGASSFVLRCGFNQDQGRVARGRSTRWTQRLQECYQRGSFCRKEIFAISRHVDPAWQHLPDQLV